MKYIYSVLHLDGSLNLEQASKIKEHLEKGFKVYKEYKFTDSATIFLRKKNEA